MNLGCKDIILSFTALCAVLSGCSNPDKGTQTSHLVVIDPGHFHAALAQKNPIEGVCDTVKVYAPEGSELNDYLAYIEGYNGREDNPTHWKEEVYASSDYLDKVPEAHKGDFTILAGNNLHKKEYILSSVAKGYNVLSDKPMAIDSTGYAALKKAYGEADAKGLVLCDLMTERHDDLNVLTRVIMSRRDVFGDPASVDIMDVHHFYKEVSGSALHRPEWYYDIRCQGEGIADVTTHYIDLIMWQCFPEEAVRVEDVKLNSASHYPTLISEEEFRKSTGAEAFPETLASCVKDGKLEVMCNGDIDFDLKGVKVNIGVRWDFQAPEGSGDTFSSIIKGDGAEIEIRQDASTGYKKQMFYKGDASKVSALKDMIGKEYPFITLKEQEDGSVLIDYPADKLSGHEEHFGAVVSDFLGYVRKGSAPEWEKINTLTKYYITTSAVSLADKEK